ncbi:MAG: carbon-phosphorus lyase complex accessory protein [Candidatus Thorarchaeota archaeon]
MASNALNLVFLGSSGGIQVPLCLCSCRTCEEARKNPNL